MRLITRDELYAKLRRGDEFRLVMTLSAFAYSLKHIPTSLHYERAEDAASALDPSDEVIVYCGDAHCAASIYAYRALERAGFPHVRRYAGGIADWEAAGLPLETGAPLTTQDEEPRAATPSRARRADRLFWPVAA
jgi:3-mercaptopyruvate sulfurtransferase SseA